MKMPFFSQVASSGMLLLVCLGVGGCDHPARTPEELGTIVDHLPDLPEVKEPYQFPEIEGHENCSVTGDNAEMF